MTGENQGVSFGVTIPQIKRTWPEALAAARALEELGYDSLWVCDHLYGVPVAQLPILEGWTLLAAVAAQTVRVGLGSLVTPPGFRNPAVFAKSVLTIDAIAPGRVTVGLGAGWFEPEFTGYGCHFGSIKERLERLEETVVILRKMFTEETPSFAGKHFSIHQVHVAPRPEVPPKILIGGGGERVLLRMAAKYADIWNNMAVSQGELARKIEVLKSHCRDVGRDFDAITVSQQTNLVIAPDEGSAREALQKAQRIYGGHMGDIEAHGIWGTPERVCERIEAHIGLGCRHFVMEFFGRDPLPAARLFATEVMPAFRSGRP